MRKLILGVTLLVICIALPARAAPVGIDAAEETAAIGIGRSDASVGVQVTGTYTGTLQFEATLDESTWVAWAVAATGTNVCTTSTTSTGVWRGQVSGFRAVRVRAFALATGTATVNLVSSAAPPVLPCTASDGSAVRTFVTDSGGRLFTRISDGSGNTVVQAPNAAVPEGALYVGGYAEADAAALDSSNYAEGDLSPFKTSLEGRMLVQTYHPNRFSCYVAASTATTVQAVGGSCAAPGAGLSLYITDVSFASSAASGTAADSFPTIKSGTGGTCGTATAVVWGQLGGANVTLTDNMTTPIKVTANNELCWIMTTAGTKALRIGGFIAP